MLKKYKFPLSMFVVFEKTNVSIYTSEKLTDNHYVMIIDKNWYEGMNFFLKNELMYNYSMLTDISAIDTSKYDEVFPETDSNNNRFILYNIYYMYLLKLRVTLVYMTNKTINSIDKIFKNANWLEREVAEMYGIHYTNKKDCRPLLLDYSKNENPLLKDFPTEGEYDIYYNFFENKLTYIKNEFVEL
jgi:NADH-quinone oxidoreductase subunit C